MGLSICNGASLRWLGLYLSLLNRLRPWVPLEPSC